MARSSRTGTGALTPSTDLAKGKDTVSRGPSSSRQLSAGIAGSMATSPLSAAVAGLDDKIGVLRDPTQAAREGRAIGDVGTGDRAIRAKDGQMIGGDQKHPAPLLHRPSLLSLLQRLHQCLTRRPTRHQTLLSYDNGEDTAGTTHAAHGQRRVLRDQWHAALQAHLQ